MGRMLQHTKPCSLVCTMLVVFTRKWWELSDISKWRARQSEPFSYLCHHRSPSSHLRFLLMATAINNLVASTTDAKWLDRYTMLVVWMKMVRTWFKQRWRCKRRQYEPRWCKLRQCCWRRQIQSYCCHAGYRYFGGGGSGSGWEEEREVFLGASIHTSSYEKWITQLPGVCQYDHSNASQISGDEPIYKTKICRNIQRPFQFQLLFREEQIWNSAGIPNMYQYN